ncbi:endo alpha-1,4 polygalactosaminidase [Angustibacter aerolatus]
MRNTNPAPARPSRRSRALRLSLGAVVALTAGCSGASSTPGAAVTSTTSVRPAAAVDTAPTWQAPPANARFDYQIGGAYTPLASVRVVSRDRDDDPVPGRYNICYVNAFQTQPDDAAWWKQHHPDLVLRKASGGVFTDPDWPGEMLLDTRTAAKRARLLQVVGPWFDGCRTSGYQAVEPDNLDTWTRSGKLLTRAGNLEFAKLLAARAHGKGMAIAQKNAAELTAGERRTVGFDFAIAEECQVYEECGLYEAAYGHRFIEIEYTDNGTAAYAAACRARGATTSVVLRDRDVVTRGRAAYRYQAC